MIEFVALHGGVNGGPGHWMTLAGARALSDRTNTDVLAKTNAPWHS